MVGSHVCRAFGVQTVTHPQARPSKIGDFPLLTQTTKTHHTPTTEQTWSSSYYHPRTFAPPSKTSNVCPIPYSNLQTRRLHGSTFHEPPAIATTTPPTEDTTNVVEAKTAEDETKETTTDDTNKQEESKTMLK